MAHWSTTEAALRYYAAEGFLVGSSMCLACRHEQSSLVVDPRARLDTLQCPQCHATQSVFTAAVLPPKQDA